MSGRRCRRWVLGAVATVCALAGALPVGAQAEKRPEPPSGHGAEAAGPARAQTPQEVLARRAGEYTRVIQFLGQMGAQGTPSTGTSRISTILNGRFLMEENNDVVFGRPVSGMRIYGYNDATGQYEAAWIYTMSPAILTLTGTSADGGKTVDYTGVTETANGGKTTMHARLRQVDNDQFVITLSVESPDGKETPFQETTYKRKK